MNTSDDPAAPSGQRRAWLLRWLPVLGVLGLLAAGGWWYRSTLPGPQDRASLSLLVPLDVNGDGALDAVAGFGHRRGLVEAYAGGRSEPLWHSWLQPFSLPPSPAKLWAADSSRLFLVVAEYSSVVADPSAALLALDLATGELVWTRPLRGERPYLSDSELIHDDGLLVLRVRTRGEETLRLTAVEPSSGEIRWETTWDETAFDEAAGAESWGSQLGPLPGIIATGRHYLVEFYSGSCAVTRATGQLRCISAGRGRGRWFGDRYVIQEGTQLLTWLDVSSTFGPLIVDDQPATLPELALYWMAVRKKRLLGPDHPLRPTAIEAYELGGPEPSWSLPLPQGAAFHLSLSEYRQSPAHSVWPQLHHRFVPLNLSTDGGTQFVILDADEGRWHWEGRPREDVSVFDVLRVGARYVARLTWDSPTARGGALLIVDGATGEVERVFDLVEPSSVGSRVALTLEAHQFVDDRWFGSNEFSADRWIFNLATGELEYSRRPTVVVDRRAELEALWGPLPGAAASP